MSTVGKNQVKLLKELSEPDSFIEQVDSVFILVNGSGIRLLSKGVVDALARNGWIYNTGKVEPNRNHWRYVINANGRSFLALLDT